MDSRDRVSGTSGDFTIQLPETLSIEGGHRARIDQLRIPLTVPTIRTGTNDTLVIRMGAQDYTITLPQANYDGAGLATVLQNLLLSAAPGVWAVVYDLGNIAMKITCSNPFTIKGGTYGVQLFTQPYTQTAYSYSFTNVTMLGVDVFYLSSPQFSTLDTIGPQGAHDTLMCAVVDMAFGCVLNTSMAQDSWFSIPQMTTQQLSFQLRDRSYNVLTNIPNFSFVMLID